MMRAESFEQHLWEAGIVEPDGIHSEFSQTPGLHGQKIEFDDIPDEDPLFDEWVEITAEAVDYRYPGRMLPEVLVSVAYGTNRLVAPVAKRLGKGVVGLVTKKESGIVMLTPESYRKVHGRKPKLALILDDAGTTGRHAANAATYTKKAGAQNVEALYTWQRCENLTELSRRKIKYNAIIKHFLSTFKPDDCRNDPEGFCAKGWKLNPYKKAS